MVLPDRRLSFAEFLEWRGRQSEGFEYALGEVSSLACTRPGYQHARSTLSAAIHAQLEGTSCKVLPADAQVQITDIALLCPDVAVCCAAQDREAEGRISDPKVVIEILIASTAGFKLGPKFRACRKLASLEEYVLIYLDARRVEVYRLNERALFELYDQTGDEHLELASIGCLIPMSDVFAGLIDEWAGVDIGPNNFLRSGDS